MGPFSLPNLNLRVLVAKVLPISKAIFIDVSNARSASASYVNSSNLVVMAESDVSSLLAQIDRLGKSLSTGNGQDVKTRQSLRIAARNLSRAMEEPGDIVERVCFMVRTSAMIRSSSSVSLHMIANPNDSIH